MTGLGTSGDISAQPTSQIEPLGPSTDTRLLGGRYRVRRLIASGGMADVHLADDLVLKRAVAVKVLLPRLAQDPAARERFWREARTLASLDSAHVVGIHDVGEAERLPYLVMPYVGGRTIDQEIIRGGAMSPQRATKTLIQILDGLTALHAKGVIHRDIKPMNILIDDSDRVVLVDLGIAHHSEWAPLTAPGHVAGTPAYLSPESQLRPSSEPTSDVYQVGLLSVLLLTGHDPAMRSNALAGCGALFDQMPSAFAAVARRALAREPSARFASAAAMKAAVEAALERTVGDDARANSATTDQRPTTAITPLQLLAALTASGPAVEPGIHPHIKRTTKPSAAKLAPRAEAPRLSIGRHPRVRMPAIPKPGHQSGDRVRRPYLFPWGIVCAWLVLAILMEGFR